MGQFRELIGEVVTTYLDSGTFDTESAETPVKALGDCEACERM